MVNPCGDCGYYDPIGDYCVLGRFEAEEKFLFYDYNDNVECPDKVCSIKELVEGLKNAFIKKEYKEMLLPLESLADILWHHDHDDLKDLANEIYSDVLELEGYDYWTGEFKSILNQNQKLRLKQKISQKYKYFLRRFSDYFLI